ncbi:hypothetical protein [Pseudemcibacter aquimaris]|uniref:hypothetical protein n=1 Tax=Pseudemcibacter aquimaris TaxID=2857064 RepID=UPI002012B900|nr:hypothetical protein [Pseudemcibacter aquimaris]MCC3859768.1 hypothetical protein [Pseudemcibacter aquimaris]WDU60162.1 hypothetical protein KW060_07815 [Pseudemcibacter aquimaris]
MGQPHRTGIYGASGSGKSTLARYLAKSEKRLIIFDPALDWSKELGQKRGWTVCHTIAETRATLKKKWSGNFKIIFVPKAGNEIEELDQLSLLILQAQKPYFEGKKIPQITFAVDEMNTCFPVSGLKAHYKQFGNICSRGRHYGINVYGLTQRIAEVHTKWRGNCSTMYILRLASARDRDTVYGEIGREHANDVKALKNFEYFKIEQGEVTRGKVPKPK